MKDVNLSAFSFYKTKIFNRKMSVGWNILIIALRKYSESIYQSVCLECCSTSYKGTSLFFSIVWPPPKGKLHFCSVFRYYVH